MESMIPSIDRFCHRIFHLLGMPSQLEWGVHDDAGLHQISLDLLGKCSKLLITEDREWPANSSHAQLMEIFPGSQPSVHSGALLCRHRLSHPLKKLRMEPESINDLCWSRLKLSESSLLYCNLFTKHFRGATCAVLLLYLTPTKLVQSWVTYFGMEGVYQSMYFLISF